MPARDRRHEASAAYPEIEEWITFLDLEGKSARTLYAYERVTAPLLRSHPAKRLVEFTSADINDELRAIPPRSRHISRSIYNQLFEWAAFDERLDRNPMAKVPKMREPRRRQSDLFTDGERAQLEGLPLPDGPLWTLLFSTGLRRGEARRLRRGNIDIERATLAVIGGKGDKDRLIAVPPIALAAVADLDLLERLQPADHLWYRARYQVGDHRRRNDPIGDTTFETWYRKGIQQAGVRYLNPHQTRHTYGWWLRDQGFDIEERQLLMGHESIATTQHYYGHLTVADLADKVAALG
jgi:integrase